MRDCESVLFPITCVVSIDRYSTKMDASCMHGPWGGQNYSPAAIFYGTGACFGGEINHFKRCKNNHENKG